MCYRRLVYSIVMQNYVFVSIIHGDKFRYGKEGLQTARFLQMGLLYLFSELTALALFELCLIMRSAFRLVLWCPLSRKASKK